MSLIDVCYEQIKDNFWYGLFGDFKLIIDKNTGYFNATKLCASGGKHFYHWIRYSRTKELISYYDNLVPPNPVGLNSTYLVGPSGTNAEDLITTGTYMREELILNLATWISIEFYHKCHLIIKDYFLQDFNRLKSDNCEFQKKLKDIEEKMSKLEIENTKLKPLATPYTMRPELHNVFAVVRISDVRYKYYTIRTQARSFVQAVLSVKHRYPNSEIVYKRIDPNSVKLFALMIEELDISNSGNHFNTEMSEEELLESIDNLYKEILKNRD